MIQPKDQTVRSQFSPSRWLPITALAGLAAAGIFSACGDDDSTSLNTGGTGGGGGSAGLGGTGGSSGSSAGNGGSAGDAGTEPDGGTGSGVTGTVTQLSADAGLLFPTTAAFRGSDNIFVVNGQLNALQGTPSLPFTVVSVPLAGGAINGTINLPGNNFFPEGIAAAADGTLYIGSTQQGTIVRVPPNTTTPDATPFMAAGIAERGVVGLEVDATHSLLWFCDSNPAGPGGAALVGVDLANGSQAVRHAIPNPGASTATADAGVDAGPDAGDAGAAAGPTAFCNDVVVQSTGNVFFTDSSGRVFRIPSASVRTPNSAQVWLEGPSVAPPAPGGFGANGLAFVGDQLVIGNTDRLIAVDPDSNNAAFTVRTISLRENGSVVALCGPDGLETVPNSNTDLVVVENGSCTAGRDRVVRVSLRGL